MQLLLLSTAFRKPSMPFLARLSSPLWCQCRSQGNTFKQSNLWPDGEGSLALISPSPLYCVLFQYLLSQRFAVMCVRTAPERGHKGPKKSKNSGRSTLPRSPPIELGRFHSLFAQPAAQPHTRYGVVSLALRDDRRWRAGQNE